jgi:hypothetical protein
MSARARTIARVAIALAILDAAVTFDNLWPTPGIRWTGGVSIELAVCALALAALGVRAGRWTTAALGGLWALLALGRYAEVTAPALYGRDVNLYWDLRFIPDVAAMVTKVAPWWLIVVSLMLIVLVVWLLVRGLQWAFGAVVEGTRDPVTRRGIAAGGAIVIALFIASRSGRIATDAFPSPVARTYGHQLSLVLEARGGSPSLPPSPNMESTLAGLEDADVYLVFVESYGAISYQPPFGAALTNSRAALERDIRDSGREVVSALVESPTFGGSSWLAHISLLSGIEVRDPRTNALLMTQKRSTLVETFAHRGFRTVGLMPGLRQRWPEGAFYRFDRIYGADALGYIGPEFGWFAIPDQYSLARFDALESAASGGRRFVFFRTISTHFPFSPTPPYQPDWARMADAKPFDGPAIVRAYSRQPDWTHFGPGYVDALSYDFAVLGGYLRRHAGRDLVMVAIGDHQPPAAVTGEGAPWTVPVHVVTAHAGIIDALRSRGFRPGLTPADAPIGRMHALLPMLLEAFGDHE